MRKHGIRLLSGLLAVMMLFSLFPAALAASKQTPVIVVPGIMNAPLYMDMGTEDEKEVFWPEIGFMDIFSMVQKLLKLPETNDYSGFVTEIAPTLHEWFDDIAYDVNGKSVNNVGVYRYCEPISKRPELTEGNAEGVVAKALGKKIGAKNVYVFNYDWRSDMVDVGKNQLRQFVQEVKRQTGSSKVSMVFSSMGTTVGNVYLTEYGTAGDLETAVYLSGAWQGASFVGELLTKNVQIVREDLVEYVGQLTGDALMILLSLVSSYAVDIANTLVEKQIDRVFDELLIPIFAYMPGVWDLMPNSYVEKAISTCLDRTKNAQLIQKIYTYQTYQINMDSTMKRVKNAGVSVQILNCYNMQSTPLSPSSSTMQSDYLIDTKYASGGATVANKGENLGLTYRQKYEAGTHRHVSADYVIDASTCILPENTWFIKNQIHVDFRAGSPLVEFVLWLTLNSGVNVHTSGSYPQFMLQTYDEKLSLVPLTTANAGVYYPGAKAANAIELEEENEGSSNGSLSQMPDETADGTPGEESRDDSAGWIWILLISIGAAVVLGGGVTAFLLIRRKKQRGAGAAEDVAEIPAEEPAETAEEDTME